MDRAFVLIILLIVAIGWALMAAVNTRTDYGQDTCTKAGGQPQKIAGEVVCFAPGVLITPKE